MAVNRKTFVEVLGKVADALSGKDLIPVFACFCFDGKSVHAYDDVVALRHPLVCGIEGAVRGTLLLNFLKASKAKDVDVTQDGEGLLLKAGRSKLTTSVLPAKDFLFEEPEVSKKAFTFAVDADFLQSLDKAMVSMGRDPSHPWRLGVCVVGGNDAMTLYSSDNRSASKVVIKGGSTAPGLVTILPPRFCELLVAIGKADAPEMVSLSGEWAVVAFSSGLKLFSRTISGPDVKMYRQLFKAASDEECVSVPDGLDKALERAQVVLPYAKEPHTKLRVADGKLHLTTESSAGNVKDAITVEHPECEADLSPDLVYRALPYCPKFRIAGDKGFVVFRGKGIVHLVTTIQQSGGGDAGQDEGGDAGDE
jgi:DNA polymerase III sliding clamp (beta) subunit (PCNA family)